MKLGPVVDFRLGVVNLISPHPCVPPPTVTFSTSVPFCFYAMKLVLATACLAAAALPLHAASYCLDNLAGDDSHDGRTPATAWRSLDRANQPTLGPGDQLLLRAGGVWRGGTLQPRGSGTAQAPIRVDRYGEGPDPALQGEGKVECVLKLADQQGWEIAHLEVTNHSREQRPSIRGVEIRGHDCGVLSHIHLSHLFVHDVNAASDYKNDGDIAAKSFGGIITLIDGEAVRTAWDDLVVEDCRIVDVGPAGFAMLSSWTAGHRKNDPATWFPSQRVILRRNRFERTGRNALVVRACAAPLIEHNVFATCAIAGSGNACFAFHCDDALFQHNEAYGTKYNPGDVDAAGFDSDYNCRRTVFQYNYSHDNDYGFILLCCNGKSGFNEGTIVRYNVSENDGGNVIRVSGPVTHARIYGNQIHMGPAVTNPLSGQPPRIVFYKSWGGWSDTIEVFKNTIVCENPRAAYDFGKSVRNDYHDNIFRGIHASGQPPERRAP